MRTEPILAIGPISSAAADTLVATVLRAGGSVPDIMTTLTLVCCKVICSTFSDGHAARDADRARILGEQVASLLPLFREDHDVSPEVLQ